MLRLLARLRRRWVTVYEAHDGIGWYTDTLTDDRWERERHGRTP